MKKSFCCALSAFIALPGVAHADSSISITLTAHVDPFCRISPPADNEITVQNGSAAIGSVREICNTPDGYDVSTHFTNLTSGRLDVGGESYALQDGFAMRSSLVPAVRVMDWSLADAQLASADLPVVMQVTISPRG